MTAEAVQNICSQVLNASTAKNQSLIIHTENRGQRGLQDIWWRERKKEREYNRIS